MRRLVSGSSSATKIFNAEDDGLTSFGDVSDVPFGVGSLAGGSAGTRVTSCAAASRDSFDEIEADSWIAGGIPRLFELWLLADSGLLSPKALVEDARPNGSSTQKVEPVVKHFVQNTLKNDNRRSRPWPGALCTPRRPPLSLTILRTNAKPRPEPLPS